MVHRLDLRVRFCELDPYGHVNHAVYVSYFEVARCEALASCGVPIDAMALKGYQLVVTNLAVRFRRSAVAGDRLTVATSIAEMRRASGLWSQVVARGDEVLVTAEVTAGVTDANGRPCRPPDWLFGALDGLRD